MLDTRLAGGEFGYVGDKPQAGQVVSLRVLGRAGVPKSGVRSVVLNVTATEGQPPVSCRCGLGRRRGR